MGVRVMLQHSTLTCSLWFGQKYFDHFSNHHSTVTTVPGRTLGENHGLPANPVYQRLHNGYTISVLLATDNIECIIMEPQLYVHVVLVRN